MPLNITQIENLVEAITDLQVGNDPSDDVPSNLVNAFIEEAYQRIFTLNTKWPWYQTIYELNTTANQRSYTTGFTQIATTATGTSVGSDFADIREIISATNESNGGNQLIYIDDFLAQKYWNGTADTPGNPIYFSMWAGELRLWPKPDSVYTINIRGFRQPSYAWLTNPGLTVDINDEFHIMIVNFVASRCYQFQEDPEMAAVYMNHFDQGAALARQNITHPSNNQPMVLSGGLQYGFFPGWNGMPTYRSQNIWWG
jgi:hypothetical protein